MSNKLENILIKISQKKIYFNDRDYISFSQTNFPDEALLFKSHLKILWEAEILNIDYEEKKISIRVVNYYSKREDAFAIQKIKEQGFNFIFKGIKWYEFEQFLSYYHKIKLDSLLEVKTYIPAQKIRKIKKPIPSNNLFTISNASPQKHKESFNIPFSKVKFINNFAIVKKKCDFYFKPIEFQIPNQNILEHYNHISSYFSRVLQIKNIHVSVEVIIENGQIISLTANSKEITLINEELIQIVKNIRILEIIKIQYQENEDTLLLNLNETFGRLDESNNLFNQNIDDLFNSIYDSKKIRNRKQLKYLAEKQSINDTLKFTLNPIFGFIYFIEGSNKNYYCWELLKSHATYLWGLSKDENKDFLLKFVEESIRIIKENGRKEYLKYLKSDQNQSDISFHRIRHDKLNYSSKESFKIWQQQLKVLLNN